MSEILHFIVTEDNGRTFRLPFSKKRFQFIVAASCVAITGLVAASCFSLQLFSENRTMNAEVKQLEERLETVNSVVSKVERSKKEQTLQLTNQVKNLQLSNARQESSFKEERDQLMADAISNLQIRSDIIDAAMSNVGVNVSTSSKSTGTANSGGPYIAYPDETYEELVKRTDKSIALFNKLPIGRPTAGSITSNYGVRKDPLNGKRALHKGTDFRGKVGAQIVATGDGVVEKAYYSRTYGNYVVINHGNGYKSSFAHMKKFVIKKGQRIKRGQLIGLLGNTGRSTGPHLHYEIHLNNKTVNPKKFLTARVPHPHKILATKKKITHVQ